MKRLHLFTFIFTVLYLCFPFISEAGFGVTPPYVTNTSLTRNSVYEQKILLVRNDPTTDLKASVSFDVDNINSWFQVEEGDTFLLPKGEQKVPMTIKVTVPKNAAFKHYTGHIRIKTGPADDKVQSGAVSIALGAQLDVDITVIDKVIKDFKVRKISIANLNEGHKLAWLYFPGKIEFSMFLENLGNVDVSPSEVEFRIYDQTGNVLLEDTKNIGSIPTVPPFETQTVTADIPTRLPAGSYIARYTIMNDKEKKQEGEVNLNILPYGTLQTAGFGFIGLSLPDKLSIILPIAFVLIIIGLLSARMYQLRRDSSRIRKRSAT